MIFAGLWFGEKKPAMWTFLKPDTHSFKALEEGVEIYSPERGTFTCKGVVLACSCDLPARCIMCNSMQYNGENGCWKCLHPGETVQTGDGGHSRAFLYQNGNPKGPSRTAQNVAQHAREAAKRQIEGGKRYGVKGPSWPCVLDHFDIVRGMAIDYMHGVLLVVQKLLLTLWFSSNFSKWHFGISSKVNDIDARLRQILPTAEIKRLPRSISNDLKYLKASELRSFLLFYGLPTLYGLLPDNYFTHYVLFVQAIYILHKSFAILYSEQFCTLNVHQLLHPADDVRDHFTLTVVLRLRTRTGSS